MGWYRRCVLLCALLAGGCGQASTAQLIEDLKSPEALTRIKAVRALPQRRDEAAQVVPALTEALKDQHADVRRGAALGLGTFGAEAKDAIPCLLTIQRDPEAAVRKAADLALSYIDPKSFPALAKTSAH